MKRKRLIIMLVIVLVTTAFYAYSQDDETVRIENSAFEHPQRSASVFDHDEHNATAELEDDCATCHHLYEGRQLVEDESSEDYMCSDCHSLKATVENFIPLRMAFHIRCKECHFESGKGPVLCGECHIRK